MTDLAPPPLPPGQLTLEFVPATPGRAAPPYRVLWMPAGAPAPGSAHLADVGLAALVAARAADEHGAAWIVAADSTACHVTPAGVAPASGWATAAQRAITNRNTNPHQ